MRITRFELIRFVAIGLFALSVVCAQKAPPHKPQHCEAWGYVYVDGGAPAQDVVVRLPKDAQVGLVSFAARESAEDWAPCQKEGVDCQITHASFAYCKQANMNDQKDGSFIYTCKFGNSADRGRWGRLIVSYVMP